MVLCAIVLSLVAGSFSSVRAAGNPPKHSLPAPSGGINSLHGNNPGIKGSARRYKKGDLLPNGKVALYSGIYKFDPVIMVHGILGSSVSGGNGQGGVACQGSGGTWSNPISYLNNSAGHPGLGSDRVYWQGPEYTVGFYNSDTNCHDQLSTRYYNWAPACNGYGGISNSDSKVGTTNESIAHIACEFAWYTYNNYSHPSLYQNVMVVAHSMGGLIVRYAIQKVQQHDSHFPSALYISDVWS